VKQYDPEQCMPTEILRTRGLRQQRTLSDYQTVYGTIVEGNYQSTHDRLGPTTNEVLEEETVGTYDALQHVWNVSVEPAFQNRYSLNVTAEILDGGDEDNGFRFSWSTSPSGPFWPLLTLTSSGSQSADFSLAISTPKTIYIQVEDTNRDAGNALHDRLSTDNLFVWQECTWGPEPSGDAVPAGWGPTNLAPYGAHLGGYLGSVVETTNIEGILQLDLLATDAFHSPNAYPTFLYYNPYSTSQTVEIDVGTVPRDVYDAVSETFLCRSVSGPASFVIAPDSAVVAVVVPSNGLISYRITNGLHQMLINGVVVDYGKEPFSNIFTRSYPGTRNNWTGRLGYTFEAKQDFRITAFGRPVNVLVNQGLLRNPHTIELFDESNRTLLASTVVNANSPRDSLDYVFSPLAQPVFLHAGRKYMILSSESNGDGDLWMDYASIPYYGHHLISINGAEFTDTLPGSGMPDPGYAYFGQNVAYVPPAFGVGWDMANLGQFSTVSKHWLESCSDETSWCEGADLDFSGCVDMLDLCSFFEELWLQ
jgi:hypothetical protein